MSDIKFKLSIEESRLTSFLQDIRAQFAKVKTESKNAGEGVKNAFKEMDALVEDFELSIKKAGETTHKFNEETKRTSDGTKTLRTQLRDATLEAQKMAAQFGANSQQFKDAAQKAANLKDEIGDMNRTFQALNPDQKLQPMVNLLQGAVGGFQALTAAQGLFGDESEDVQKALLKVQQVMLFGQGINSILALKDEWKNLRIAIGLTTVTQEAATIASEADAVAKGTQAAATGAATTATNAFTAALLANPLTAVLVALAAVTAGLFAYSVATEEAAVNTQDLLDKINDLSERRLANIDTQRKIIEDASAVELSQAEGNAKKILEITKDKNAKLFTLLNQEIEERKTKIDELQGRLSAASDEEKKSINDSVNAELTVLDKLLSEKNTFRFKDIEAEMSYNKALKAERDKAKQEYEQHLKELQDLTKAAQAKLTQMQIENATDSQKLSLIQAQREAEINDLEAHFKKLNAILKKGYEISPAQSELIAKLRLESDRKTFAETEDLARAHSQTLVMLIKDEQAKEIEAYKLGFDATEKALKQAGATQMQVDEVRLKGIESIRKKYREKDLTDMEKYEQDMLIINTVFDANDLDQERKIAIEKLEIHKKYLEARLQAAEYASNADTEEGKRVIYDLKAQVKVASNEIENLKNVSNKAEISWAKIFGFKGKDADDVDAALSSLMQSAQTIGDSILGEQERILAHQQEMNQQYVDDLSKRIDGTEAELQRELDLSRQGYANNVTAKQRELAQLKAEQQKALVDQKRLAEEKRKIQKQEAIVDAASTASKIILSVAQLFAAESIKGVAGVVIATAGAASIIASMIALKAKIKQSVEMREGGTVDFGMIRGRKHERGGHRIEGTNITVEDGEYLNSAKATTKYGNLLEAVNSNRMSHNAMREIRTLLENTGVTLNEGEIKNVQHQKSIFNAHLKADNNGVERRIDKMNDTMVDIKTKLVSKGEHVEILRDGTKVITNGIKTTYIR